MYENSIREKYTYFSFSLGTLDGCELKILDSVPGLLERE